MSRAIGGLRRLLGAPGLWLGTWVGLWIVARLVAVVAEAPVAAAVGPYDALDRDAVLFGLIDVLRLHPAASAGLVAAVLGGALVSGVAWLLLSPLVIARLAGHRTAAALGARALAGLPGVVVQSLWHALLRGALVLAMVMAMRSLPGPVMWIAVGLGWLVTGVALDASRVAVVEHAAAPWHPKTAWRGLVRVIKRPAVLLPGVLLGLGQLLVSGVILWLALAGLGGGAPWGPRLLALVSVGLGLWRVAVVVDDASASAGAAAKS